MKLKEIQEKIDHINFLWKEENDYEMCHIDADCLYRDVLKAIADGTLENAGEAARLALTVEQIGFSRYYA